MQNRASGGLELQVSVVGPAEQALKPSLRGALLMSSAGGESGSDQSLLADVQGGSGGPSLLLRRSRAELPNADKRAAGCRVEAAVKFAIVNCSRGLQGTNRRMSEPRGRESGRSARETRLGACVCERENRMKECMARLGQQLLLRGSVALPLFLSLTPW